MKKVLIANRGEIALRIMRSCKEMGIKTVAVYSTADRTSLHVKFADEAVCIGGPKSQDSYLNIPNIMAAAEITNADAIHPGYGFLAENAKFARTCAMHDLEFIGPQPEIIDLMGNKSNAKETMKKFGVPVIEGSKGIVKTYKEAEKIAKDITYPVMLKAVAGGGGKGMRIVPNKKYLRKQWDAAKMEAKNAFGNDDMYIEKFVENPKHVEIQVFGDKYGKGCHLSERDCSIQRRNQKLLEETPSPVITKKIREKMGRVSVKAVQSLKYTGAGTIEFLLDKSGNFYFMEMNTRIQVEHPITEEATRFDLIKEQLKIAAGEKISGENYYPQYYSIECRVNAEDPDNNFAPSPGKITDFHLPGGNGIRVDSHVYQGYTVPPYYDSMIAKIISVGRTREEAIKKMSRALDETIIQGVKTTIPFHKKILVHPDFLTGKYTTKFIEKHF